MLPMILAGIAASLIFVALVFFLVDLVMRIRDLRRLKKQRKNKPKEIKVEREEE